MSIAAALAELERSPALPDHLAYLQRVLAEEQCRREQFAGDPDRATTAEFINGRVLIHPPAQPGETAASLFIASLLTAFATPRAAGAVYRGQGLVRTRRNDYQPDVCFFTASKCAGFEAGQKTFPPPDLIVEVLSPSSEGNDRELKHEDYARHGIGEYWIVDPEARLLEQYVLSRDGEDFRLRARLSAGGRLTSVVLAGFSVPVAACFDAPENQRVLRMLDPLAEAP